MKNFYLLFIILLPLISYAQENIGIEEINNTSQLKAEVMQNNNISMLEANYIYSEMTRIIDAIQFNSENTNLLRNDFNILVMHIKELVGNTDVTINKEEVWSYMIDNTQKVNKELEIIKDRLKKEYEEING